MSNELTLGGSLVYNDTVSSDSLSLASLVKSISTTRYTRLRLTVTTSEVAIPLGSVSSLGWALFINRDTTNFIELRIGTGGTKFAKLVATNGFALLYLGSGITAPYAIADTASCVMEYFLVSQ